MLTKLIVRNFKRFREIEVELGNPVVLIGPNNSGKTTALQALALWEAGLRRWKEKRGEKNGTEKRPRPGVTINRRDLVAVPVPYANLLWRDLHVRDVQNVDGKPVTKNIRIDIIVEGVTGEKQWQCGLEFDYANEESFYCRPLRLSEQKNPDRMPIPPEVEGIRIAFLPPMSGLAANEIILQPGAIEVRVGEGRTAEILRNLCYKIYNFDEGNWKKIVDCIQSLFGSILEKPKEIPERGEIIMSYKERGSSLDLSSSGRGLQQTLLLISYMYANQGSVLLLDEPDAHLEILRQRQIYQLITDIARENGNQIIIASHSEVLLSDAAEKGVVVAFVGQPHRINDRGTQLLKSLKDFGWEHYYQAEQTGWVLYLEGSTDLAILQVFAQKLKHQDAMKALERPFVYYVINDPGEVRNHFFGLREAVPHLLSVALFDRLEKEINESPPITWLMWKRREIENYICCPESLLGYAQASAEQDAGGPLFTPAEYKRRTNAMNEAIQEVNTSLAKLGRGSLWDSDTKVSDEGLKPLFKLFYEKLGLPNIMTKKNYHVLARYVPDNKLDEEIREKLDAIVKVARAAKTASDES